MKLWAPPSGEQRPAFSAFLPTSDSVVFQRRWDGDGDYSSWHGAHSELWWVDLATQKAVLLNMDAPQHTKLRRIVSKGFTPRSIAKLEDTLRDRAERIVSEARKKGSGDEARCSTTDPEARNMKMGDGGFRPAYNVQFATDGDTRMIVAVAVTNNGSRRNAPRFPECACNCAPKRP